VQRFWVGLVALVVSLPLAAQVNSEAFRDYFLVGEFGEVCTMCEVTVLCERGDAAPDYSAVPENTDAEFTLYHLQTRTFWSQVGTIYEWFVSNFSADGLATRGHTRPVHVYEVSQGKWSPMQIIEGRLVLEPALLEFGDHNIDRTNRAWLDAATGRRVGYCQRLPLWGALDVIAARSAGGQP
jgi:hypothetical protein